MVIQMRSAPPSKNLSHGESRIISHPKTVPPSIFSTTTPLIHPEDYRIDLCVATDQEIPENEFGIRRKTIPGGKCAVLRHIGSDDQLSDRITYLYATWLPLSQEEPRDFPLYLQRVSFFPDVPEHEAIIDLFLPLQ
jgi:AraC family transcriptional regulator